MNQITLTIEAPAKHVEVPLIYKGSNRVVALIDAEDANVVLAHRWYWQPKRQSYLSGYALATPLVDGRRVSLLMHRLIMGLEVGDPMQADHRDSNGLDNRRANLRLSTKTENLRNRRRVSSATGFKGVYPAFPKAKLPFFAICARQYLGMFATAVEAALAYDKCARERFGEFAATNADLVGYA